MPPGGVLKFWAGAKGAYSAPVLALMSTLVLMSPGWLVWTRSGRPAVFNFEQTKICKQPQNDCTQPGCIMIFYRFAISNSSEIEHLGGAPLVDDDAATAFGNQVIRDLRRGPEPCAGGAMLITEGERTVARIPIES